MTSYTYVLVFRFLLDVLSDGRSVPIPVIRPALPQCHQERKYILFFPYVLQFSQLWEDQIVVTRCFQKEGIEIGYEVKLQPALHSLA